MTKVKRHYITKVKLALVISAVVVASFALGTFTPILIKNITSKNSKALLNPDKITQKVIPKEGVNLNFSFKGSVAKMVELGAIDKEKFESLYKDRGGTPKEIAELFDKNNNKPVTITQANANTLLNILWPLGLSNKTEFLKQSPMGKDYADKIGDFASTGGWTLGKISGGKLFNTLLIVPLTEDQEKIVSELAQNIYRPCCGNSTFFPDCNHGAAMLGFLELAVSQGMPKEEIYKKALILNSYWFPQTYVELATYFQAKEKMPWEKVSAKEILSNAYSSSQGYLAVNKQLQTEGLIPKVSGGGSCGV